MDGNLLCKDGDDRGILHDTTENSNFQIADTLQEKDVRLSWEHLDGLGYLSTNCVRGNQLEAEKCSYYFYNDIY